ncbi:MAG: hypothetical protein Q7R48_00655 [bacterium]|nr:hypothetical protein [bacterium]
MRIDKEKALALRLLGYSYNEITAKLDIPKATLSDWFTGLILSEKAHSRIRKRVWAGSLKGLIKKNELQVHRARQSASQIRKDAKKQIKRFSKSELLLVGTALYWAEGYKRPVIKNGRERTYHKISFSNSDPFMVKVFLTFLEDILEIPRSRIKASIRIFQHINEGEALRYWENITKLPKENFQKTYYGISKSSLGKRPFNRLPYGTIQIIVGDTKKFHRIMGWIEGMEEHIQK